MKTDKLLTQASTTAATLPTKATTTTIISTLNSKRPTVIVYPTGMYTFIIFSLCSKETDSIQPQMKWKKKLLGTSSGKKPFSRNSNGTKKGK